MSLSYLTLALVLIVVALDMENVRRAAAARPGRCGRRLDDHTLLIPYGDPAIPQSTA